ncbi:MAG: DUF4191 domain-containing protein [Nocardioidaceae bacterium]|nr:MAG: DUF4191 domain-containing protein [Nocardioidaceae bacterium]
MAEQERPKLIQSIRMNYRMTKQEDPKLPLILLGAFVGAAAVLFALAYLLDVHVIFASIFAVLGGFVAMMYTLARRSSRAMYAKLEGTPGAAYRVMTMLRRRWTVEETPVAFNKQQDLVIRVVGPPGIVLVGEGNPNRLKALLTSERRKHERVVADVPIHEVVVGYDEGQVPLKKLNRTLMKMKRQIRPAEMTDILSRLRALNASGRNLPLPKGPLPTSMKGQRGNLRGR